MAARRTRSPVMFWLTSRRTSCTWGLVLWCSTSVLPFRESSQARTKEELMAQPYVGEIRMFAGSFPPAGWMTCAGQLLPISENEILFQLIGTTYGGDGESTFALPDLQGRIPIPQGNNFTLAEQAGVESVTLTTQQIPSHTHPMLATETVADSPQPQDNVVGKSTSVDIFIGGGNPGTPFSPLAVGPVRGSQPHTNFQPYLCVTFIISLFGIYPPPS